MPEEILKVKDLKTHFYSEIGTVRAVDGISFSVKAGEIVSILGESGSGKSMTALSILNLVPPPGRIIEGSVEFHGVDLLSLKDEEIRRIRGAKIGMVFQEPMSYFNPVYTIGYQIRETILSHLNMSKKEAEELTLEVLRSVGFPSPKERKQEYPHQMSGGMLQRAMIAMAICCNPELVIADEPTTALDVTIQFQILNLLKQIRDERGTAIILITHDFGIVAEIADRVIVMNAGRIVEEGRTIDIFDNPKNEYTVRLLDSMFRLGRKRM